MLGEDAKSGLMNGYGGVFRSEALRLLQSAWTGADLVVAPILERK